MFDRSREKIEYALEAVLFASRWLLAPFYLGLAVSVAILLIKFVQELYALAVKALFATEAEAILGVLSLVDLALTGLAAADRDLLGLRELRLQDRPHQPSRLAGVDGQDRFHGAEDQAAGLDRCHLGDPAPEAVHGGEDRHRPRADVVRDHPSGVRRLERAAGAVGPHLGRGEGERARRAERGARLRKPRRKAKLDAARDGRGIPYVHPRRKRCRRRSTAFA